MTASDKYLKTASLGKEPPRQRKLVELEGLLKDISAAQSKPGYLKKVVAKMESDTKEIRRGSAVNAARLSMRIQYRSEP